MYFIGSGFVRINFVGPRVWILLEYSLWDTAIKMFNKLSPTIYFLSKSKKWAIWNSHKNVNLNLK